MGFTPSDVNKMSLWEFMACHDGYSAAHGGKPPNGGGAGGFSDEQLREIGIEGF